jgi:hypothetical protein
MNLLEGPEVVRFRANRILVLPDEGKPARA